MLVKSHFQLNVFQQSIEAAVLVFRVCMTLPPFERHLLVNQWLRASRSVAANIAEAWRKRYYKAHFASKLSDAEAEAAECQVWALLAFRYGYVNEETSQEIIATYDGILAQLSTMARDAAKWELPRGR